MCVFQAPLPFYLVALLFSAVSFAEPAPKDVLASVVPLNRAQQIEAAQRAGDYLCRALADDGRFVYAADPQRQTQTNKYNLLRHAGTIVSLCQLYEHTRVERYRTAANRASRFLITHLGPVVVYDKRFIVPISRPELIQSHFEQGPAVKTGGVALTMIAFLMVDRINQNQKHLKAVQQLAAYLRNTQQESGALLAKYIVNDYRYSTWISLYYLGESLVALGMLEAVAPDPKNRETLCRLLVYKAETWQKRLLQDDDIDDYDHWGMLGVHHCFDLLSQDELIPYSKDKAWTKDRLLGVAIRYCDQEVRQMLVDKSPVAGSFRAKLGRVTPTTIRLEGIGAIQQRMRSERARLGDGFLSLFDHWDSHIALAERFIINNQYPMTGSGEVRVDSLKTPLSLAGGIRREYGNEPRAAEVRIDYCQHAISAWLGW